MSTLLDTNVLSELSRPSPSSSVVAFLNSLTHDETYISAISIGELTIGILRLSEGKRRNALELWLDDQKRLFSNRALSVDTAVAERWAQIATNVRQIGLEIAPPDLLIAATASVHGMRVATRNVRHFAPTGVPVVNPWEYESS